jgi:hypothetical protein
MPDPRLNCAAQICCVPTTAAGQDDGHRARVGILLDLGVRKEEADSAAKAMVEKGIVFLSAELAASIREIAFPG